MKIRDGFIGTVGNTPLIKLRRASEETGCTILGKAEFLNPGGSVKDRAALCIIKDAEERGLLRCPRSSPKSMARRKPAKRYQSYAVPSPKSLRAIPSKTR